MGGREIETVEMPRVRSGSGGPRSEEVGGRGWVERECSANEWCSEGGNDIRRCKRVSNWCLLDIVPLPLRFV